MPTLYNTFQLKLRDPRTGLAMNGSGWAFVCAANDATQQATVNATTFVANTAGAPIAFTNGVISFAVVDTVTSVDVYVLTAEGRFVELLGAKPGTQAELNVPTWDRNSVLKIPFSATDSTAATEKDTGIDLPANCVVLPDVGILVTTIDATEDITFGLLSSESGGDADGFGVALSVATAGLVMAKSATTATRGALIGAGTLDRGHASNAVTAKSISYTLSTGSDTAEGFLLLPLILAA